MDYYILIHELTKNKKYKIYKYETKKIGKKYITPYYKFNTLISYCQIYIEHDKKYNKIIKWIKKNYHYRTDINNHFILNIDESELNKIKEYIIGVIWNKTFNFNNYYECEKKCYRIFKITNILNGKVFINYTENTIDDIMFKYIVDSNKKSEIKNIYYYDEYKLYKDFNKYGVENFKFVLLKKYSYDFISSEIINKVEKRINIYDSVNNGYNIKKNINRKIYDPKHI